MKLSIITPVYNVAAFLEETVKSILNQTFTDFELILVDDGSTDGSAELCDTLAKTDSRIRVFHKPNSGVSDARNMGLDNAIGEYIGWVDSDDIIEPDMFECLIGVAEKENADIVQCEHDRSVGLLSSDKKMPFTCKTFTAKELIDTQFTLSGGRCTNFLALWSKVYKRHLFENNRFPSGRTHEDHALMCKIVMGAKKILVSDCVLYHYVKRENSIITGFNPKKHRDIAAALYDNTVYLKGFDVALYNKSIAAYRNCLFSQCVMFYKNHKTANEHKYYWSLIKENKKLICANASVYDRLYISLISLGLCRSLITKNNFEPIQKIISKIKK